MAEPVVTARGLGKRFGHRSALSDLDLTVGRGETWAVLGRNGAGKSTLLRLMAGLAAPTTGVVRIHGGDPRKAGVRRALGIVTHQTFLLGDLTVEENLRLWCRLHGMPGEADRVSEWIGRVGLDDYRRERASILSRGQAQRLTLARALLPGPDLLLLDEPFTGLDVDGVAFMKEVIRQGERTTILVTHDVEAGRDLADHMLLLKGGRNVYSGEAGALGPGEIRERF